MVNEKCVSHMRGKECGGCEGGMASTAARAVEAGTVEGTAMAGLGKTKAGKRDTKTKSTMKQLT